MSRLESLLMNLMWHGSWRSRVMEVFPVIRWVSVMLVNSEDWPQKKKTKTKTRFNLTHRHEHRHTDEQTRMTVSDSPVHGAALSPFSLEDQIPPDQLRDREKTEVKMSEIKPTLPVSSCWPGVETHTLSPTESFLLWCSCWSNGYDEEQRPGTGREETQRQSRSCGNTRSSCTLQT